jgi:hypothetical protein
MILLLTLIEILVVIAIIAVLGTLLILAFKTYNLINSGPSPGPALQVATQLQWVTKPDTFKKNTETLFVVKLQKLNAISGNWNDYGSQDALVGAVEPASVSIVKINGSAPGNPVTSAALPAGVTVFRATSDTQGNITFTLLGTAPADGQLFVFYV